MYTTEQLKKDYKKGRWAWPGGYEIVFITSDGQLLCFNCVRKEARNIKEAMIDRQKGHNYRTGWEIDGTTIIEETFDSHEEAEKFGCSIEYCCNCNKPLNLND